jgi:hypothetical protein
VLCHELRLLPLWNTTTAKSLKIPMNLENEKKREKKKPISFSFWFLSFAISF